MTLHEHHLLRIASLSAFAALLLTMYVAWELTPVEGDLQVIRAAQDVAAFKRFDQLVNPLGNLEVQLPLLIGAVVVLVAGPWVGRANGTRLQRTEAIWMLIAAMFLRVGVGPLKAAVQADRPSTTYDLTVVQKFDGYGFPSGHVYSDVLMFGVLAVIAPLLVGRTAGAAMRVLCLAIIVLAGPARMVVGAHWPSDVLGGYLWGATALCVAVVVGRRLATAR